MHALTNRISKTESRRSSGFSLIELITVTAILTIVLSGILAVFLGSMKAVRQGYRHMDAYEMSRGTFQVVQRDLTGAFTSREHGDYYQFFGTPYGMVFVGVASNFQSIGNNSGDNLCRVSYVIRQISGDPITTPHKFDVLETQDGLKPGYVLVRFVEMGIDSLDTYKFVDWTGAGYGTDPELPSVPPQEVSNMLLELNDAASFAQLQGLNREDQERFVSAKKRELWLRMLRGNGPVPDTTGTLQPLATNLRLPSYFGEYPMPAPPRPDVLDYVVATNLYFDEIAIQDALNMETDTGHPNFGIWAFDYGFPYNRSVTLGTPGNPTLLREYGQQPLAFTAFWNASPIVNLPNMQSGSAPLISFGGEGSPLLPRIPAAVHFKVRFRFPAPNVAAAEIQRVLDQTVDVPSAFTRAQMGLS